MSGFIKKILAFGAVLVLLAAIIEIRVCYTFNGASYKKEYMEKHAADIKTLLVGASHAANGIDPAYIGDSCFDLASSSQLFCFTRAICVKFLPSCANVKNVILPIDYQNLYAGYTYPLSKTDFAARKEESAKCGYFKYMGLKENASDWIYWPETVWAKQAVILRCFKDYVTCDSLGFSPCYLSNRGATWKKAGLPGELNDELGNADLAFADNVQNIRTIARLCKERGARLILLSAPYYETAQKLTSAKHREAVRHFVDEVRKGGYDNVIYKEYTFDPRFSDDDFFNSTHLNADGAAKFAKILRHDFNL